MVYTTGGTIEAADYNQLIADINKIFGVGIGDFGYGGQSKSPNTLAVSNLPDVPKGSIVDNQQWLDLRTAFVVCADHQGTTLTDGLPSVDDIEDGDVTEFFPRLASSQNLFDITVNRFKVDSVFTPIITSPLTSVRTIPWASFIQHEFTIRFDDTDHARAFFNTGGTIRISALRTGGSATVQNGAWDSILSSNSPFIFGREQYFALTSAFEDLRPQVSPASGIGPYLGFGAYSISAYSQTSIWSLQGRRDDAQGPNGGNGSIIRISSNFLDGSSNPPDSVDGTFTSTVQESKFNDVFDIQSPQYQTLIGVDNGI